MSPSVTISIDTKQLMEAKANMDAISNILESPAVVTQNTEEPDLRCTKALKEAHDKMRPFIELMADDVSAISARDTIALRFGLEDTIEALKNIRSEQSSTSRKDAEHADPANVDKHSDALKLISTMLASNSGNNSKAMDRQGYIKSGTGAKKNSNCAACKEKGHWVGDKECSLYEQTAKKRRDKAYNRQNRYFDRNNKSESDSEEEEPSERQLKKARFLANR